MKKKTKWFVYELDKEMEDDLEKLQENLFEMDERLNKLLKEKGDIKNE